MFKKSKVLGSVLFLLLLVGCGSDDVTTTPPIEQPPINSDKLVIDQYNSDLVLASTLGSVKKLGEKIDDIPRIDLDKIPGFGLSANISPVAGIDLDIGDIADICTEGGSANLNSVTTTTVDITFKNCKDKDKVINGRAKLKLNSGQYHLVLTNFSYDTEAYFDSATIDYDERDTRKDFKAFVSSGFVINEGDKIGLDGVTLSKISNNYAIDGTIGTECLGGVVLVKTISYVTMNVDECPTAGEIYSVGGNGSTLGTTFNGDKSIDTFLNNETREHYNSCLSLPKYNEVCL